MKNKSKQPALNKDQRKYKVIITCNDESNVSSRDESHEELVDLELVGLDDVHCNTKVLVESDISYPDENIEVNSLYFDLCSSNIAIDQLIMQVQSNVSIELVLDLNA